MSEFNSSLNSISLFETVDLLIHVKLDEHDTPEFLRKAPKVSQLKFAAALRSGLEASRKKREEDKKNSKVGDLK